MQCHLYERQINNPTSAPAFETWCRTHNCRQGDWACLRLTIYNVAHLAATLGSGSDGYLRGRFMSISNALNAAIGRQQSSHGDQYDAAGNIVEQDAWKE